MLHALACIYARLYCITLGNSGRTNVELQVDIRLGVGKAEINGLVSEGSRKRFKRHLLSIPFPEKHLPKTSVPIEGGKKLRFTKSIKGVFHARQQLTILDRYRV